MRKIIGFLLLPFLYTRFSFIIVLPISYWFTRYVCVDCWQEGAFIEIFLLFWFFYGILYGFVMGNLEVFIPYTKWILKKFKIEYEVMGYWKKANMHNFSTWRYPIINVDGRLKNLSLKEHGGNNYDYTASLNRCVIFTYFFNSRNK